MPSHPPVGPLQPAGHWRCPAAGRARATLAFSLSSFFARCLGAFLCRLSPNWPALFPLLCVPFSRTTTRMFLFSTAPDDQHHLAILVGLGAPAVGPPFCTFLAFPAAPHRYDAPQPSTAPLRSITCTCTLSQGPFANCVPFAIARRPLCNPCCPALPWAHPPTRRGALPPPWPRPAAAPPLLPYPPTATPARPPATL